MFSINEPQTKYKKLKINVGLREDRDMGKAFRKILKISSNVEAG